MVSKWLTFSQQFNDRKLTLSHTWAEPEGFWDGGSQEQQKALSGKRSCLVWTLSLTEWGDYKYHSCAFLLMEAEYSSTVGNLRKWETQFCIRIVASEFRNEMKFDWTIRIGIEQSVQKRHGMRLLQGTCECFLAYLLNMLLPLVQIIKINCDHSRNAWQNVEALKLSYFLRKFLSNLSIRQVFAYFIFNLFVPYACVEIFLGIESNRALINSYTI